MIFQLLGQLRVDFAYMNFRIRHFLYLGAFVFAINANAGPMAYSVNSDSGDQENQDSLYEIDLATGADTRQGTLLSGGQGRTDTEGLAIHPDGTLWGVDDEKLKLFPINKLSGSINFNDEIQLSGFSAGGSNDFGMTFNCEGSLYVTSVVDQNLYKINISDGSREQIGADKALGANISAIAAYGSPMQLYGLGNGQFLNGDEDVPNLYWINPVSGVATLIGALGADEYNQGGLSFDADGTLWAITDRRIINNSIENKPSQIMRLNLISGAASYVSQTTEVGFESLAASAPAGCGPAQADDGYAPIPAMNPVGRLITVLSMLMAGMFILRRRFS